jgi:hypothetical protein
LTTPFEVKKVLYFKYTSCSGKIQGKSFLSDEKCYPFSEET